MDRRVISKVKRSRKTRRCDSYCEPIQPGDLYIEHTEFPGGESGYADAAGHPVRMAECCACAQRCGRGNLIDARRRELENDRGHERPDQRQNRLIGDMIAQEIERRHVPQLSHRPING